MIPVLVFTSIVKLNWFIVCVCVCVCVCVYRGTSERDAEEGMLNLAQGEFTYGTHTYTVQVSHPLCVFVCMRVYMVWESFSTVTLTAVTKKQVWLYISVLGFFFLH